MPAMQSDTQMTGAEEQSISLPGFGQPLEYLPEWDKTDEEWSRYPHAIADCVASEGVTLRERRMLEFINQITDKPEWERKVYDEEIVAKWHGEACKYHEDIGDDYLSEPMWDYCIAELREKAERFKKTNLIAVMDAEATIIKSDKLVSAELAAALRKGVEPLEQIPEHQKDWHPGSDGTVLDLVHPSMCPLVYGRSRALLHGHVPLKECSTYSGEGEFVEKGEDETGTHKLKLNGWDNSVTLPAWGSFQWLPADIQFREDGTASIGSYINNLHPMRHAELYPVMEKLVDCAVPMWNEALSWFHDRMRIPVEYSSDEDYHMPEGAKYDGASDHSEGSDFWWDDQGFRDWKENTRVLTQREPREFRTFEQIVEEKPHGAKPVDLRKKFADSGLQVIFKLANIILTPDKPEYEGGSWHIEGALNEHIVSTALYYYDQTNITDSYLSFRQSIDCETMVMKPMQHEYSALERHYGIEQDGAALQELGQVLTREGRMLAFPNVLQHRVHNFRLKDPTKPGHRKILVMFLVDPHIRVLSTANVPPQQKDWWKDEVRKVGPLAALPLELFDKIIEEVTGFPMGYEEACEVRDELMAERGLMNHDLNEGFEQETFFFCEH